MLAPQKAKSTGFHDGHAENNVATSIYFTELGLFSQLLLLAASTQNEE